MNSNNNKLKHIFNNFSFITTKSLENVKATIQMQGPKELFSASHICMILDLDTSHSKDIEDLLLTFANDGFALDKIIFYRVKTPILCIINNNSNKGVSMKINLKEKEKLSCWKCFSYFFY
jgi:hypothetical protein